MSLAYAASLTWAYGWAGGPTTQTYAWGIGLGLCARAWQVRRDLRALRGALANPAPATPAPLGEPTTTET